MNALRSAVAVVAAVVMAGSAMAAQAPAIPGGATANEVQAAAEREGSTFTRAAKAPDATPRTCVLPWEDGPARSGEFSVGGNLTGRYAMHAGQRGKISWTPLHAAKDMPPLVIRGRNLTTLRDTVRDQSSYIAWPVTPGVRPTPEAKRQYFFLTGLTVPTPGRWLVIATSGANWGCFILTVA